MTNKYGKEYHKSYRKYIKKKLLKEKIWNYDKYNGKIKLEKDKFSKKKFLNKFRGPYEKWEKYLLLGCVVHSIQDYQAHSLDEADTKTFRDTKNPEKNFSQEALVFHSDWMAMKMDLASIYIQKASKNKTLTKKEINKLTRKANKDKKDKKISVHSKYKDNPFAAFTYDRAGGRWVWVEVSSAKSNKRYVNAIANSKSYFNKVAKKIK